MSDDLIRKLDAIYEVVTNHPTEYYDDYEKDTEIEAEMKKKENEWP